MPDPIWITYAWRDDDEGDFSYLVNQLEGAGISAVYDTISLIPGRRLWTQIADRIGSDPLSGWAFLITPNSLASSACLEELTYALQRALESKGKEFPLIGLLHNVSIRDVPMALRVRLCVNLANPDWIEEIRAGIEARPPRRSMPEEEPLVVKVHREYMNQKTLSAIEIRPRFGELRYWRIAFPTDGPQPVRWGAGPSHGGGLSGITIESIEGEYQDLGGVPMRFVGAGNILTAGTSAYAVFDGALPERIFFGVAEEPFGAEAKGTIIHLHTQ